MRSEPLHAFQHLTFFATAALLWWALIHGRYGKVGYGVSVLFVFATVMHTSVLGALISIAPRVLYPIYQQRSLALGWDPLEDQELAGILMWVPSGVLLTLVGLALFAAWLGEAERRARRAERATSFLEFVNHAPKETETDASR
jgi:cytochrome c oxidase assembly factor CtaG